MRRAASWTVVAVIVAGCASDAEPESAGEWCGLVEEMSSDTAIDPEAPLDADALDAAEASASAKLEELEASAPSEIKDELAVMNGHDFETTDTEEQRRFEEAQAAVNAFLREECGSDKTL